MTQMALPRGLTSQLPASLQQGHGSQQPASTHSSACFGRRFSIPYEDENPCNRHGSRTSCIAKDLWATLSTAEVDEFGDHAPDNVEALAKQEIIALIAYLQRLGTDITK